VPALGTACFPLPESGAMTVGRTSSAAVVIDQPTVSRIHAEINCVDGVFSIHDKGSYNGTVLNHRVLEQGEAIELKNGDVVIFGEAQLVFGDLKHLAKLI
jgi:pSer/pThr/pTyr-binding forkhead associated (FHA) protein